MEKIIFSIWYSYGKITYDRLKLASVDLLFFN